MGRSMVNFDRFQSALEARERDIKAVLPSHIPLSRFRAVALSAAKTRPEILEATPNSLFGALTKAATDGLLPDGREGVILTHRTKARFRDSNGQWKDRWENVASWIPMLHGTRKRAKELEGILITAEVVYENDHFRVVMGDEPSLEHEPPSLGSDRGGPLGAYAIVRKDGEIIHREVMDAEQIEAVGRQSKSWRVDRETGEGKHTGLMWREFWSEAWRKTVIKRAMKSVPVGESLDRLLARDNDQFEFEGETVPQERPRPRVVHSAPAAIPAPETEAEIGLVGEAAAEEREPEEAPAAPAEPMTAEQEDWMASYRDAEERA